MEEREQRLWHRIEGSRAEYGVPKAVCSAISPFPFWAVITAMVIFIPLALILSFFVKRHAILIQGGELVVLDLSFWKFAVTAERQHGAVGSTAITVDGSKLVIEGQAYHLEPGWRESAEKLIAANDRGAPTG